MIGSPFERTRSDDCLSDLAIDRLVGEREAHPHLRACERCADRFRELEGERDRFAAKARPLLDSRSSERDRFDSRSQERTDSGSENGSLGRTRTRAWAPIAAVALAASIGSVFLWPSAEQLGFRTKGGPQVAFYVKHGEQIRRGDDGEVLSPKDAVRFAYSAEQTYHLAVFSLDPAGRVSIYYPAAAETRAESPGAEIALPLSTILDDSVGEERIWALFCERSIDLAAIKSAIESERAPPPLAGCHARTFHWNKEP
jgi:hypothetical protein